MNTPDHRVRHRFAFDTRADLPIALVIGAGGLGTAIAQRLGQDHRVVLASLSPEELAQGQERLHELGVVSATMICELTEAESVDALAASATRLGPVQSLAHVAALSPASGDWRRIMSVNLTGAARIEQTLLPSMAVGGAAVFISSLAGHIAAAPDHAVLAALDQPLKGDLLPRLEAAIPGGLTPELSYSLSKLALNRLVRRRAAAWGRRQVRIVSLSPGLIDTPMGVREDVAPGGDRIARLRSQVPLQRDGSMAEVVDAAQFLLSHRARYISGTDLLIDGGLAAALSSRTQEA